MVPFIIFSDIAEKECVKERYPRQKRKFFRYSSTTWIRCGIGCHITLKWHKLKFHWDQFPRNFPVANVTGKSPTSYEEVTRKLATFRPSRHVKMVWRVANFLVTSRKLVTGKLATSPSPRGSYGETGSSGIRALRNIAWPSQQQLSSLLL